MKTFNIGVPILEIHETGSHYICNPPVEDTDIDWIILIADHDWEKCDRFLGEDGWKIGGSVGRDEDGDIILTSSFQSYKCGKDNLIITSDPNYYEKFIVATKLAKRFNLLKKEDRIACFKAVIHGEYVD